MQPLPAPATKAALVLGSRNTGPAWVPWLQEVLTPALLPSFQACLPLLRGALSQPFVPSRSPCAVSLGTAPMLSFANCGYLFIFAFLLLIFTSRPVTCWPRPHTDLCPCLPLCSLYPTSYKPPLGQLVQGHCFVRRYLVTTCWLNRIGPCHFH